MARHGGQPATARHHAADRHEAFAEEKSSLKPLPLAPFRAVLRLKRRGAVEVHTRAEEIRIFEDGALIATHPVLSWNSLPV